METPAQTCARIVAALEDLAGQEAATLEARDFAAAIAIQERAAPLVQHLGAHASEVAPEWRARLAAVHARRLKTGEWLADQVERVREQLETAHAARQRVAQIAPVYGRSAGVRPQWCAVG